MKFRDLQAQYDHLKDRIDSSIQNVLNGSVFIGGRQVQELEKALAEYVGVKHCISCANGTDALQLVLMAWGIGEGDAVFIPDFTFFATGEVVGQVGATPVFVDVDIDTFNLDCSSLELAILKIKEEGKLNPAVIIPVDLFGLPANYSEIETIASKHDIKVLEDGAQGFGGSLNSKRACSFGDAATTSFFPAKPLGCYGDGGAVFTNDDCVAELIESLKVHGKGTHKYDNVRIGMNSRLDTMQAAILNVKFAALVEYELDRVNWVYREYTKRLSGIVKTPIIPEGYHSSFAQYTIQLTDRSTRDYLQKKLRERGIPTMVYYEKPMHEQRAFEWILRSPVGLEVASRLCETVLSLPMHPYLREADIDYIGSEIIDILNRRKENAG